MSRGVEEAQLGNRRLFPLQPLRGGPQGGREARQHDIRSLRTEQPDAGDIEIFALLHQVSQSRKQSKTGRAVADRRKAEDAVASLQPRIEVDRRLVRLFLPNEHKIGSAIRILSICMLLLLETGEKGTKFVEDGVRELLKARRVLCGSYVYGYYLEDDGYNKTIFEFMQVYHTLFNGTPKFTANL